MTAPQVVTVTFPGDPLAPQLEAFGQSVASSAWWDTVRAGYCEAGGAPCVGDGPPGVAIELTSPPAASYTDSAMGGPSTLAQWLSAAITSGALPAPDTTSPSNTLYVLYFPATTTIDLDGMNSCVDDTFDGYHSSITMGAQAIAYAVVVECTPQPPSIPTVTPATQLQSVTVTASHEIVEAATDPLVSSPAYYLDETDKSNWGWTDIEGGEVADLCVDPFGLGQDQTTDGPFTVQRIWSNAQAASMIDPCNPIPTGDVYFNASPRQSFFVLDVGGSATFAANAFADGPTPDWTLSVSDWSDSQDGAYLAFSISGGTSTDAGPEIQVHNGSTVQVTVTLLREPGGLPTQEADGALVSASNDGSPHAHWWPFAVMSNVGAAHLGIDVARRRAAGMHRLRPRRSLARAAPR